MSRPTILQLLAHGPATQYELSCLAGLNEAEFVAEAALLVWPGLLVNRDDNGVWFITAAGLETLGLAIEATRMRERDAACEGVTK